VSKKIISTLSVLIFFTGSILTTSSATAGVSTSPTFSLDASDPSSLATSSPIYWYDLVSNRSIFGDLVNSPTYSNTDGGVLNFNGVGNTGINFGAQPIGHATNPSGSMTLESWVKFTSWNVTWNIFASRWFINLAGTGTPSDFHFAVKVDGSTHKLNLYTTSTFDTYGSADIALNKWYLLGFTLDNSTQELKFYVNGQQDGATKTGITRTANASNMLFVGDPRTTCGACSFNGQMARFRMWNSALSSTQMLSNFRSEGSGFGYSTTTSLSAATFPNPSYRNSNLITATVSKPGKVTFYQQGVVIPGCKNKTAASTTATCSWKPSRRGKVSVTASLTPTDLGFVPSNGALNFQVSNRSGARS
jgi:hypothetical protein